MKYFILVLITVIGITFMSCHKKSIEPKDTVVEDSVVVEDSISDLDSISIFGTWLLIDGKMYMDNLDTGDKTVYNHFDENRRVSTLRYGGYIFEFEKIIQDSTTWSFIAPSNIPGTGEFWLDNDSIQPYGFHITSSNMNIIESNIGEQRLGGSSRPIITYIYDYDEKIVNFYIQEMYESIDGINYKYFSELKFKKIK